MKKTTTTEYTFTPDDLADYVKSQAKEVMTLKDVDMTLKVAYETCYLTTGGIIAFCEMRDAEKAKKEPELELKRILPIIPKGLGDLNGRLYVGEGYIKNNGLEPLSCIHGTYAGCTGDHTGEFPYAIYEINPTAPIEEVNEALARFGFAELGELYYHAETARPTLFGEEYIYDLVLKDAVGWRPIGGIGGAK